MGMAAQNTHHGLATHEVILLLETDAQRGLSAQEAQRRLQRFGPNLLPQANTVGPLVRFVRQFNHPLVHVLLAAGMVTLALGELVDAAVIFGVVLVNAASRVCPGVAGGSGAGCTARHGADQREGAP